MGIDYSKKMSDLIFNYDADFYPIDASLPDPQIDPILPGATIPIQKVGIAPVDMPIYIKRKNMDVEDKVLAQASLYCSLDDPQAKGLNLSRFYLLMMDKMANKDALGSMQDVLYEMAQKQGSDNAYVKLRFKYPWFQHALRTRKVVRPKGSDVVGDMPGRFIEDGTWISDEKLKGHIAYNVEFEGRWHKDAEGVETYKYYLTVDYIYSSTCPCSFELAKDATDKRGVAANAHSQRSRARVTIEYKADDLVWIEDIIELCRKNIPTEVQVIVKRRDEQAFAELNGSNLLFSEDVCKILYKALDEWEQVKDFCIVVEHFESLHPWNAVCVVYKGVDGGLK
jgi:GTP cyclohydrolase IB